MVTEVNRLKKIINEMILLAKLDSEQEAYHPKKRSVSKLIEQVIDRTLPGVNEKNIDLYSEQETEIELFADEGKLLQALLNITMNGIRYAQSTVKLTVEKKNHVTMIMIEDDGYGILEELQPHVFHRFVKGKDGETGLGLAISRAIIEQSGGRITVAGSDLGGAKFVLTFVE